jgi:phage I-like protein
MDPGPEDALKPALAARLAQAMGLPDDTPEEDVLALVARMVAALAKMTGREGEPATALAFESTPDPRRFVPVEAVKAMMSERATTLATASEERAAAKVADAMRRGHVSPAMKGWATALCRSDEAAFDAFLASVPPAFAHLSRPSHARAAPPATVALAVQSEAAAAICAQLGLPAGALRE